MPAVLNMSNFLGDPNNFACYSVSYFMKILQTKFEWKDARNYVMLMGNPGGEILVIYIDLDELIIYAYQ